MPFTGGYITQFILQLRILSAHSLDQSEDANRFSSSCPRKNVLKPSTLQRNSGPLPCATDALGISTARILVGRRIALLRRRRPCAGLGLLLAALLDRIPISFQHSVRFRLASKSCVRRIFSRSQDR